MAWNITTVPFRSARTRLAALLPLLILAACAPLDNSATSGVASGGPGTPVATRGSVAANVELLALVPTDQLPPGFQEVGRGPAAFPATDGEAPFSASVAYQDEAGNRISFIIIKVERPQLARNRLSYFGVRYRDGTADPGCRDSGACVWNETASSGTGDISRSFVSVRGTGETAGAADFFVRGVIMAGVEVHAVSSSTVLERRAALLHAFDARIAQSQP